MRTYVSIFSFSLLGLFLFGHGDAEAKAPKKPPLKKALIPPAGLAFQLGATRWTEEKTIQVVWPGSKKDKVSPGSLVLPWSRDKIILGLTAAIEPDSEGENAFSLRTQVPQRLHRGDSFSVVVGISYKAPTTFASPPPSLVHAQLVLRGSQSSTGELVTLLKIPLSATLVYPPKLDCKKINVPWVVQTSDTTAGAAFQCTNNGWGALQATQPFWDCTPSELVVTSPPITIAPKETKTVLVHVASPTTNLGEYSCSMSIGNGSPAYPKLWEDSLPVQLVSSRFALKKDANHEGKMSLSLKPQGTWELHFRSTTPGQAETVDLVLQTTTATNIEKLKASVAKNGMEDFHIEPQGTRGIRITFAPQKIDQAYNTNAFLEISYQDAKLGIKTERLYLQLSGSSKISRVEHRPAFVFDVDTRANEGTGFLSLHQAILKDITKESSPWIHSTWTSPFPNTTLQNDQIKVAFPQPGLSPARARLMPYTVSGTLDLYRRSNDLSSVEQFRVPLTVQFRPPPLGWVLHVYLNPGLNLNDKLPLLATRFGLVRQFEFPTENFSRSKRALLHVGVETMAGGVQQRFSLLSEQLLRWNTIFTLSALLRAGHDLTSTQRIQLFGVLALGYGYMSQGYLPPHDFQINFGAEAQFRPSEKIPALLLNARLEAGVSVFHQSWTVHLPIGLSLG